MTSRTPSQKRSKMLLKEIADLVPYEYQQDGDGATFYDKTGNRIGVVFEDYELELPARTIRVFNVAFGTLKPDQQNRTVNLDQALTNAGDIRRVISTVGEIVAGNADLRDNADLVIMAGSDAAAKRRSQIYLIAFLDIKDKKKMPRFYRADTVKFENGTTAVVAQSAELTPQEIEFIKNNLRIENEAS